MGCFNVVFQVRVLYKCFSTLITGIWLKIQMFVCLKVKEKCILMPVNDYDTDMNELKVHIPMI